MKSTWIGSTILVLLVGACVAPGCGDDDDDDGTEATGGMAGSGGGGGEETGGTGGLGGSGETGGTGGTVGTGGTGGTGLGGGSGAGGGAGAACVELTVINHLSWCSVSVAGENAVTDDEITVCVPPGEVALEATAESGFQLGDAPWHETDGDTGDGEEGTVTGSGTNASSATTVTVSGEDCVWVCCPFPNGSGCDIENPCP
jgi:hypothetical protein